MSQVTSQSKSLAPELTKSVLISLSFTLIFLLSHTSSDSLRRHRLSENRIDRHGSIVDCVEGTWILNVFPDHPSHLQSEDHHVRTEFSAMRPRRHTNSMLLRQI